MKKNMSVLYFDFLGTKRKEVFAQLSSFSDIAILGGGTALCVQLNHRKSYDFDLFTKNPIERTFIKKVIKIFGNNINILVDSEDELSFLTPQHIKVSFISFPFTHLYQFIKTPSIPILHWKDIASDKAYVIGRRGEYRDYIDIFFVLKKGFKLEKIIDDAKQKFKGAFSEKLFLGQLVYFNDLKDFTVDFIDQKYSVKQIKQYLEKTVAKYTKKVLYK